VTRGVVLAFPNVRTASLVFQNGKYKNVRRRRGE